MKKYILMFIFVFILSFFIKIPKYVELNEIKIIKKIEVNCINKYSILLVEIEPIKKDNGISYKYKKYHKIGNNFINTIKSIEKSNKKYFYYKSAKLKINGCKNKKEIENYFSISD